MNAANSVVACLPDELAPGALVPRILLHEERPLPFAFGADARHAEMGALGFMRTPSVARLVLHEYLPDVPRAIWLDIDTVVKADVGPLYDMHMDHALAAVPGDKWDFKWTVEKEGLGHMAKMFNISSDTYFNSGVVVMDLLRWRDEFWRRDIVGWGQRLGWLYADQVALNMAFRGDFDRLDARWNMNTLSLGMRLPRPCADEARVLHFNGGSKCFRPGCVKPPSRAGNDDLYEFPTSQCARRVLSQLSTVCDEPGECLSNGSLSGASVSGQPASAGTPTR